MEEMGGGKWRGGEEMEGREDEREGRWREGGRERRRKGKTAEYYKLSTTRLTQCFPILFALLNGSSMAPAQEEEGQSSQRWKTSGTTKTTRQQTQCLSPLFAHLERLLHVSRRRSNCRCSSAIWCYKGDSKGKDVHTSTTILGSYVVVTNSSLLTPNTLCSVFPPPLKLPSSSPPLLAPSLPLLCLSPLPSTPSPS